MAKERLTVVLTPGESVRYRIENGTLIIDYKEENANEVSSMFHLISELIKPSIPMNKGDNHG